MITPNIADVTLPGLLPFFVISGAILPKLPFWIIVLFGGRRDMSSEPRKGRLRWARAAGKEAPRACRVDALPASTTGA
jgi:hypothetical protein